MLKIINKLNPKDWFYWTVLIYVFIYIVGAFIFHTPREYFNINYSTVIYFTLLILPFVLPLAFRKNPFIDILSAIVITIILHAVGQEWVNYQNKPWFSPPETFSCDGPCYGWYTFENDIDIDFSTLAILGCATGVSLRLIFVVSSMIVRGTSNFFSHKNKISHNK